MTGPGMTGPGPDGRAVGGAGIDAAGAGGAAGGDGGGGAGGAGRVVPGLAVERTVLAWTRTWLTLGACGLLLLRLGSGAMPPAAVALLVGAASTLAVTGAGLRRTRYLRTRGPAAPVAAGVRAAGLTAATATVVGLAAAALIAVR